MDSRVYFKIHVLPRINGSADLAHLFFWNNWYPYANYEWNGFHHTYRSAAHKMELKIKTKQMLVRKKTKLFLKYLPLDSDTSKIVLDFF